jgi:phosphomethylpyrimidine synthase
MTQLERARRKEITPAMQRVAEKEGLDPEILRQRIAEGTVVVPANKNHSNLDPCGIGQGLRTKVNANIGTSEAYPDMIRELRKLQRAIEAGADTVMDLSTGGDIRACRRQILAHSEPPVGTVPLYQVAVEAQQRRGSMVAFDGDELFEVIEEHARDGVDFFTVHCGVTYDVVERLRREGRVTDIVSRGGALMVGWMLHHQRENPLYAEYDRLLEIARRYDVTLSLGDGLRPGCLLDATDRAQIQELIVLGELVERAWEAGVQVMVEGPGHVPLNQIEANVLLEKRLCHGAPFYVLGPLVTDVAPGYDHIVAAIGGAVAASFGADFLCYVTPAEHLGLPTEDDVAEGVIAARIAAHVADLVKGVPGALEWDRAMAEARKNLDWEKQVHLAIDSRKAKHHRAMYNQVSTTTCSMCGSFCAMQLVGNYLGKTPGRC